jgi:hypothetical protein
MPFLSHFATIFINYALAHIIATTYLEEAEVVADADADPATALSPLSSDLSSLNSPAASRIRLNSMQKAWTSINKSLIRKTVFL